MKKRKTSIKERERCTFSRWRVERWTWIGRKDLISYDEALSLTLITGEKTHFGMVISTRVTHTEMHFTKPMPDRNAF